VGFRYSATDEHPDHSSLAEFRKRHWAALAGLFTQALQLCQKAGLVKLGHVAIDGSKLQGNASKHKAMSYERMGEREKRLQAEVEELLKRADAEDAPEEEKYGKGQSGEELPGELARRESRLAKIRAAKAELEAEAREQAEEKKAAEARIAERREQEARTGKKTGGAGAAGARSGEGDAGGESAAQFYRSRQSDHAGRESQGQFRAGVQRAGGGGWRSTGDCSGGSHPGGQ
jgi:hypothetical protein